MSAKDSQPTETVIHVGEEEAKGIALWEGFAEDSSMHGLKYISRRGFCLFRRVLWLLMILGSLGYFVYASKEFLTVFINQKISTSLKVEKSNYVTLPTITICNKNIMRSSVIKNLAEMFSSEALLEIFKDLYVQENASPPPEDKYNWSNPEYASILASPPEATEATIRDSGHPLNTTLVNCVFEQVKFNCSDVFELVRTSAGYCYQFNGNGSRSVRNAGISAGLTVYMDAQVSEYFIGPYSESEGFFLTFHEPHEEPLVNELSVSVGPGNEAFIMLQKLEVDRHSLPDENAYCFDTTTAENILTHYSKYSFSGCVTECKTKHVINKCGCREMNQPAVNGTPACDASNMLYCAIPTLRRFVPDSTNCYCPIPCHEIEYTTKMSTSKFPSTFFASSVGLSEETIDRYEKNFVKVNIYFGKMSYQRIIESQAYTFNDMLASLGGMLGLCVGASILTIGEFLEFSLFLILRCFKTRMQNSKSKEIDADPVQQINIGNNFHIRKRLSLVSIS